MQLLKCIFNNRVFIQCTNGRNFAVGQRRFDCLTMILNWKGPKLADGNHEKIQIDAKDEVRSCKLLTQNIAFLRNIYKFDF